jgi:hypothetical protein
MMMFLFGSVMFLLGGFFGLLIFAFLTNVNKEIEKQRHLRLVKPDDFL